jgi:ArsR family transcriptional regulator, arsenate/arsenite/antimonite-responsive transcriptional repressor
MARLFAPAVTEASQYVDISRHMDELSAIEVLAALAQPTRLGVFRQLAAAYPGDVPAGDIARRCDVPHNTMSSHLAILTRAGLTTANRQGRVIRYRADLDRLRDLVAFLARDCCEGRPELCVPLVAALSHASEKKPCKEEKMHGGPTL